ncbi:MAG: protein kinase [Myxococcota bacterium]|nr:protein kinase [Myxococcota bacterium]MDW8363338.1 protein kinase [Myxococcales bacterium]
MSREDGLHTGQGPQGRAPEPVGLDAGTRVLWRAARTLAERAGGAHTVVDVLQGRALRQHEHGLRQYLAIRMGDVQAADRVLSQLRAVLAARGIDELVRPPGIRARLYRAARELVRANLAADGARGDPSGLPWRAQHGPGQAVTAQRLAAWRASLPEEQAEPVELHHARGLPKAEVAWVLERGEAEVSARIALAERSAREALGLAPDEGAALRSALVEAFALDLQSRTRPADGASLAPGTVLGGRYAIEARVGAGAFAEVYRARDTEVTGHVVAVKLLHQPAVGEQARAEALRELHLIASVFHPSIVQFKDHGWYEDRLWFVMPWYEGETLQRRIDRAPLGRAEARRIFEPLARALAAMHAVGLRHQDVKPDNIFLARIAGFGHDGEEPVLPVLLDLGVAAREAELVVAGTPTYFAPEVAAQFAHVEPERLRPIGPAADVFALALSLRNALEPETAEEVSAGDVGAFIEHRAFEPPAPPSRRELRFLKPSFERWLALDPDRRPTADEFADELRVLTAPEERRERRLRVLRWALPLGTTIAVLLGAVGWWYEQRRREIEDDQARTRARLSQTEERLSQTVEQMQSAERAAAQAQAELQQQIERLRRDGSLDRAAMQQRLEELAERAGRLGRALEEARAQSAQLSTQLAQSEERSRQTSADLEAERRLSKAVQAQLAERDDALRVAREAAEARAGRIAELEQQLTALRAQLHDAEARARQLDADLARERERAAAAEAELSRLRNRPEPSAGEGAAGTPGGPQAATGEGG